MNAALGKTHYLFEFNTWETLYATPSSKQACNVPTVSRLFLQYTCEQSLENQTMKYNQMCLISASAILIALLFTILMRKLYQGGKMQKIDWDMATITAGDYTAELPISLASYNEWKTEHY